MVLAYHNVLPVGQPALGDRSLHLALAEFCTQLDLLQAHCEIVALPSLLRPANPGERPRVGITFDDAYRGAVIAGVAELVRRGLPATIFVAPGLLGDRSFWWDQAAEGAGAPEVPPAIRVRALGPCRGSHDLVRADWRRQGFSLDGVALPPALRSATEAEVTAAAAQPGISLGAHSWSHPNLVALEDVSLQMELDRPLAWLRARYPAAVIPWLAYPYGLHDPRVHAGATRTGFAAALRVEGGWLRQGEVPGLQTPRLNVPAGISAERFRIQLSALPWL